MTQTNNNTNSTNNITPVPAAPQRNGWRTFGIVIITVLVTLGIGYWLATAYLFPTEFTPVKLNEKEQRRLDQKIERLSGSQPTYTPGAAKTHTEKTPATKPAPPLEPEPYTEEGASREIFFTEKELNALLANNTDLASKLAIDLSDNLASAKLLVPLDPEFPVLGGKTLKVTAGMELALINGQPRAVLKGVSVWGVPMPNAWLGNMKNTDLIKEFGDAGGFWQAIKDGVDEIEVEEGKLRIKLKE